MFTVYHSDKRGGFKLRLRIAQIEDLFLHEEIVPTAFDRLVNSFRNDRALQHPIIVDDRSNVILDGMHRTGAFQKLNYKYIVVCGVDYHNPLIEIKNWYRVFYGVPWDESILERVEQLPYCTIEELSSEQFQKAMMTGHAITGIILPDKNSLYTVMVNDPPADAKWVYNKLVDIENLISGTNKYQCEYKSESAAQEAVETGGASFALATRRVLKNEVVHVATHGGVFPPKTTRHVIPVRPLFINVPLSLLSVDGPGKDADEKTQLLDAFLRQRRLVKVRGHTTLDRFYEEDYLYLFT